MQRAPSILLPWLPAIEGCCGIVWNSNSRSPDDMSEHFSVAPPGRSIKRKVYFLLPLSFPATNTKQSFADLENFGESINICYQHFQFWLSKVIFIKSYEFILISCYLAFMRHCTHLIILYLYALCCIAIFIMHYELNYYELSSAYSIVDSF